MLKKASPALAYIKVLRKYVKILLVSKRVLCLIPKFKKKIPIQTKRNFKRKKSIIQLNNKVLYLAKIALFRISCICVSFNYLFMIEV